MVLAGLLQAYPGWLRITRAILRHYQPKVSLSLRVRPVDGYLAR
jgi:hypothetical protein